MGATQKRAADIIALKKLMIEKGFKTIGALADVSGIGRTTLGKVLDGKIQPSTDTMFKLMDTLDIPDEEAGKIFFATNLRRA